MAAWGSYDDDRDPLEQRYVARAIVLIALVATGLGSWLGIDGKFHDGLPGIALGSPFLIHVERALVVGAGIAAILMFAVRGWAGYFPAKISTSGAEYFRRPALDEIVESEVAAHDEILRLEAIQERLARSTRLRLDGLDREIASMKRQRARNRSTDDML